MTATVADVVMLAELSPGVRRAIERVLMEIVEDEIYEALQSVPVFSRNAVFEACLERIGDRARSLLP